MSFQICLTDADPISKHIITLHGRRILRPILLQYCYMYIKEDACGVYALEMANHGPTYI